MHRSTVSALAALALIGSAGAASARDVAADKAAVDGILAISYPHLDALYKDIHAHPELGFQETRTAALLAAEMRAIGFEVTEKVGKTGLVAVYRNGTGPTVLVRTELDALPMEEKTGLPYASHAETMWNGKSTFVDHSCGHDIHMAAWVGTAQALVRLKDRWHGTLVFIGQPAEEEISGAKAMLADGLFTRFPKPDYGFALHTMPAAYGLVAYRPGVLSSNADDITITFKGRGGHGASPERTIDPVMMAARFIVDVQGVVSREKDPQSPGVVTIGAISGGSVGNIIPDQVLLRGTIRDYDEATRAKLIDGVTRTAKAEATMAGAPEPEIVIGAQKTDAVVNDTALAERTGRVFKAAFGDKAVLSPAPITASEDYSAFIQAGMPALDFQIGVYDPKRAADAAAGGAPLPSNHSPLFAPVPEPTIRTGVEAMTLAVINVMQPGAPVSTPRGGGR
jgi:amidohydrolase